MFKNVKAYVLFYRVNGIVDKQVMTINNYRYFMTKKELSKFLSKQNDNFLPLAIQKLDVSNTLIVNKHFKVIENAYKKGGEQ